MKKYVSVILGGTFENIHAGHIKLLSIAVKLGDILYIGLTSDEMASKMRGRKVLPYDTRFKNLNRLLKSMDANKEIKIFEINDEYGPSIFLSDLDIIIVSTETFKAALKINEKRREKGLRPLIIYVINLLEHDYGVKISSSLINQKLIDEWGRRR